MPETQLDYTRFDQPAFAPGEEQRLRDREHEAEERSDRVDRAIAVMGEWNESEVIDFLLLAKRALEQVVDLRTSPPLWVAAYEAIDDAWAAEERRLEDQ